MKIQHRLHKEGKTKSECYYQATRSDYLIGVSCGVQEISVAGNIAEKRERDRMADGSCTIIRNPVTVGKKK